MKQCPSYPGYSVSESGQVFSHRFHKKLPGIHGGTAPLIDPSRRKTLTQFTNNRGYKSVGISIDGVPMRVSVHRMMADAFYGPSSQLVRHLDGNPGNNHFENLAYGTSKDNAQDCIAHGRRPSGERHALAKLSDQEAEEIRSLRQGKMKVKALAAKFSVSVSAVESVIYGKSYEFKRVDKPL